MARPEKDTADYYPHYVAENETLTIIENTFGNDGYVCFHKLKEILCKQKKHVYDARNHRRWMLLVSKMGVSEEKTRLMLNLCAEVGYIDSDLWENLLIWCEELVENLGKLYEKRKEGAPLKPNKLDY